MLNIEVFHNLNYLDEFAVINTVKSWIARTNTSVSLDVGIMYVFHYDLHDGHFEKLDVFKASENAAYTKENFITAFRRLFISHDGQGNFYLYFDGRQARTTCEFWQGKWETSYFDYRDKPFAVFKPKYL